MREQDDTESRREVMEQLKALGYVDPGAGSSMWQMMLAGFLKTSARIRSVFKKPSSQEDSEAGEN